MKVLVIDVGGSNVKMVATGPTERRRFRSGTHMTPDRLVAAIGIQDLVVIDTPDALLICSRSHSQDVKRVVEALKRSGRIQYL